MTTYLVQAPNCHEGLSVLVDLDDTRNIFQIARKIAREWLAANPPVPEWSLEGLPKWFPFFDRGSSVHVPVPDDCKGILFTSHDQLYERVPALKAHRWKSKFSGASRLRRGQARVRSRQPIA